MPPKDDKGIGLKGWISGSKPKTRTEEPRPEQVVLDKHRMAILPFTNISPESKDEYLADGMTEELISTMSKIRGLRVIARTSVMGYKGGQKKISEVAKELEVGAILEGSVRKSGERLRITVQLIDSQTSDHMWAETYDRELKDVFAIQSDVASKVASSLSAGFFYDTPRNDTNNIEAYTLYVRAIQLYHERTEPSLREAVSLFNRAISKDPTFARAYAGLSQAWMAIAYGGYEEFTVVEMNAEVAATNALELDPASAEAHSAMSNVHSALDRFDESNVEAEKAIEINPSLAEGYLRLGTIQASMGRLDQALASCRKAFELDPLSVGVGYFLASICRVAGKDSEGLEILERMNELHPRNLRVYVGLAEHYMLKHDYGRAQEILDAGLAINPREPLFRIDQGMLYALSGRRKEAEMSLAEVRHDRVEAVRLSGQLVIQAALGNLDEAFEALWRQVETHSWPTLIKSLPIFEEMRMDPRFMEFCVRVGLPTSKSVV